MAISITQLNVGCTSITPVGSRCCRLGSRSSFSVVSGTARGAPIRSPVISICQSTAQGSKSRCDWSTETTICLATDLSACFSPQATRPAINRSWWLRDL